MNNLDPAALKFIRWAIQEGPWNGCSLDGCDIQDKAIELGLLKKVKYDPAIHGPNDVDADPGDDWFVFSDLLTTSRAKDGKYKLVPVEPTEEMLRAAEGVTDFLPSDATGFTTKEIISEWRMAYKAMLAASPSPDRKGK